MTALPHLKAGDTITPDTWNAQVDAINAVGMGTALSIGPTTDASVALVKPTRAVFDAKLADLHARFPHVTDFGAVGDDATDDTTALQAAINAYQGTGEVLWLEARTYLVKGTLAITGALTIRGRGQHDAYANTAGTYLVHDNATGPLFSITTGLSTMTRLEAFGIVERVQIPPAQTATSWAPVPMPPCIDIENTGQGVVLSNLMFGGVWWGVKCVGAGRLRLYDVDGQCFRIAVLVDGAQDLCHASALHFWDFWCGFPAVLAWMQANHIGLYLGRCDGFHIADYFDIFGYAGIYCTQGPFDGTGPALDINIANCYIDQAQYSILIDRQFCKFGFPNYKTAHGSVTTGKPLVGSRAVCIRNTGPYTYNSDGTATTLPTVKTTGPVQGVQGFIGSGVSFGIPDSVFELQANAGVLGVCQHHATWNNNANGAPYALVGSGSRVDIALPPYTFGGTTGPMANDAGGLVTLLGNIVGGAFNNEHVIQGPTPPGSTARDQVIASIGTGSVRLSDGGFSTILRAVRAPTAMSDLLVQVNAGQTVIGLEGNATDSLAVTANGGQLILEGGPPLGFDCGVYAYANLPSAATYNWGIAVCTNARVGNQAAGQGTGALVWASGGAWYMLSGAPILT